MKCKLHSYLINLSQQERKRLHHFLNGKDIEFPSGKLPSKGFMDAIASLLSEMEKYPDAELFQKEAWYRWQKNNTCDTKQFSNQQSRMITLLDVFMGKIGIENSTDPTTGKEAFSILERLQREIDSERAQEQNELLFQELLKKRFRTVKNLETMIVLVFNRSYRKSLPGEVHFYHQNLESGMQVNEEIFHLRRIRFEIAQHPAQDRWPLVEAIPSILSGRNELLAAFDLIRILREENIWNSTIVNKLRSIFNDSEFPYSSHDGREACLAFLNTAIWFSNRTGPDPRILEEALDPVSRGIQKLHPQIKINVSLYENLCAVALLTRNLKLAKEVADNLSSRISEEGMESGSHAFAMARVAQLESLPDKALKLLKHSYTPKGIRKLRWYVIRIQLLAETRNWRGLESEAEAFRKWLEYNSAILSKEEYQKHLGWLSLLRRMLNLKPNSKHSIIKIREEIETYPLFRDFLRKMLQDILQKDEVSQRL